MRETFNIRQVPRQNPRAGSDGTLHRVQRRVALITLILAISAIVQTQNLSIALATGGLFKMRTDHPSAGAGALLLLGALCAAVDFASRLSRLGWPVGLLVVVAGALFSGAAAHGQNLTFSQAAGGIAVSGSGTAFSGTFGNMNALAVGAVQPGLTALPMSNGTMYYTPIKMNVQGFLGSTASVTAYASTTGVPVGTALIPYGCPYNLSCSASGSYSVLSTASGSPTNIVSPAIANNTTVTMGLGFFLPDNNGAPAYTGTSTVVVTFTVTGSFFGFPVTKNVTFSLSTTVQDAVRLTLSTAPGGVTIATASDYSLNFGNVNALGIGPAAGLTTSAVAGGMTYSTPYVLDPAFGDIASTTSTIKVYVSTNFAHPTILKMQDATSGTGPFTAISTNAGAQTQITAAAADRSAITRYLGLFVSNINGATAFNGTDNATLTFTLTVP